MAHRSGFFFFLARNNVFLQYQLVFVKTKYFFFEMKHFLMQHQLVFVDTRLLFVQHKTGCIMGIYFYCHVEGVHLTLTLHFFSVQVKSGTCYITGQWGRAQNEIKET